MSGGEAYRAALDRACSSAGQGDADWNFRFRKALAAEGLTLHRYARKGDRYPDGVAYNAPHPFGKGSHSWVDETFVVWLDDHGQKA